MKTQRDLVLTALAIGTATTATGVALTPLVAPAMLGAIGFSAAGPVAGMFPSVSPLRQHLNPWNR
jgi:hypothetical protein